MSRRSTLVSHCKLHIIAKIKKNLSEKNLKAFENSCFGHLLRMNPLTFQRHLLRRLLLQIDIPASNTTTLVFKINNSTKKFIAADFEFITGLPLGSPEAAATTTTASRSRLIEDVFGGKKAIFFKDVEEAFLDSIRRRKGKGELALKLAFLYLLYGVVLPCSNGKMIELSYIHLADDLAAFLAFPWGRIGHEFLVLSVLRTCHRFTGSAATIAVSGFTSALQVWLYEVMPSIGTRCADRLCGYENLIPRIRCWSSMKHIHFDLVETIFKLGGDNEASSAEASSENESVEVEPLTSTDSDSSTPQEQRSRTRSEDVVESVASDELVKEATPARQSRLGPNPIPINVSQSSLTETERIKALVALASDDNPALHTPQPLLKTRSEFEISKAGYEKGKALYEKLLDRAKCLKLWVSYAQFEAFAMVERLGDMRIRLKRSRAVFERGLSYFRGCAPNLREERAMLLKEWFVTEYMLGDDRDVARARARLPQKLKKIRRVQTQDRTARYEEYDDYLFPEEKDVGPSEVLKKHKTTSDSK